MGYGSYNMHCIPYSGKGNQGQGVRLEYILATTRGQWSQKGYSRMSAAAGHWCLLASLPNVVWTQLLRMCVVYIVPIAPYLIMPVVPSGA